VTHPSPLPLQDVQLLLQQLEAHYYGSKHRGPPPPPPRNDLAALAAQALQQEPEWGWAPAPAPMAAPQLLPQQAQPPGPA
jgi:hypothetical protein